MTTISACVKFKSLATCIRRRRAPSKSRFLRFKVVTLDFGLVLAHNQNPIVCKVKPDELRFGRVVFEVSLGAFESK